MVHFAPSLSSSKCTIDFGFMFRFSSGQDPVMQQLARLPFLTDVIIVANGIHGRAVWAR
jgi:hypothetical protein